MKIKSLTLGFLTALVLLPLTARAVAVPGADDATFTATGANATVKGVVRQSDDKLVVVGQFTSFNGTTRRRIVRLSADGATDTAFNSGGFGADSSINAVALASDGTIVIGGDFGSYNGTTRTRVARLLATGGIDTAFAPAGGANGSVSAVAVQSDGKVLIAGSFTAVNGVARTYLTRLTAAGAVDTAFNTALGTGPNAPVQSLALDGGNILIAGNFTSVSGSTRHRVARLTTTGALDATFVPGTTDYGNAYSVSVISAGAQAGKILVVGNLSDGSNYKVLRLTTTGAADSSFNVGLTINSDVTVALGQSDGKVLIGGYFTTISDGTTAQPRNNVARLNANGTLDTTFDSSVGANSIVSTLLLQSGGNLVAGGYFTTYDGAARLRITRIVNDVGAVVVTALAPTMTLPANATKTEDTGSPFSLNVTAIAAGAGTPPATTVIITASVAPAGIVTLGTLSGTPAGTPALGTVTLPFTLVANGNGVATVTVTATDSVLPTPHTTTSTFTITVTAVNDAPTFALPTAPLGPWTVSTLAGTVGTPGITDGAGTAASFNPPYGVAADSDGNVYVADTDNHTIRKITPAGVVSTYAGAAGTLGSANDGSPLNARFKSPKGVAVDGFGNVYVADTGNHTIRKIAAGGAVTTLAGVAGSSGSDNHATDPLLAKFSSPTGVAVDGAGNVYVADAGNHKIRKLSGSAVTTLAGGATPGSANGTGTAAQFNTPTGVALDAAGNVYVADYGNHTIRKVTSAGVVTTLAGLAGSVGSTDATGAAARFTFPSGVAVDAVGSVYVTDYNNHTVRVITSGGVVSTLAGSAGTPGSADGAPSAARFNFPTGVALDGSGNVYVADSGNHTVRKITPTVTVPGGDPTVTVLEDSGASSIANFLTSLSPGPNEASQAVTLAVTIDLLNPAVVALFDGVAGQPVISAAGTLTFKPATNANGSAVVTLIATDSLDLASDPVSFLLNVTAVNDAPVVTLLSNSVSAVKNSPLVTIPGFVTTSAGPADEQPAGVNAQSVSIDDVSNNNNNLFALGGQPAIGGSGQLMFTPAAGMAGTATVTVTTVDSGGTANGGVDTTVTTFTITVYSTLIYVENPSAVVAGSAATVEVTVPVKINAAGDENSVGFTLTFDQTKLTYSSISAANVSLTLISNATLAASGKLGVVVRKSSGAFSLGVNEMVSVTFTVASSAPAGTTPIGYSSTPVYQQVTKEDATIIDSVAYADGTVTITALGTGIEGDVTPSPTGKGFVGPTADALKIGRLVAGLDSISTVAGNNEFQRADCAPLVPASVGPPAVSASRGDGRLTVADWVQAIRFGAGLDLVNMAASGPTVQATSLAATSLRLSAGARAVRVVGGSLAAGRVNTVTVQLDAQGNEAGISLSLAFDPAAMTFVSATPASGASGGMLMVNNVRASSGKLGLVLVLPAGSSVAAGTRDIVTLTFNVASAAGSTAISVTGDAPVAREVADVNANILGASFVGASFNLILPVGLKAAGMERVADGSPRLVIRHSDDSAITAAQAAKYAVEVTSNLGGAWTLLPNGLVLENGALKIVDPAASGAGLRLYKIVETP